MKFVKAGDRVRMTGIMTNDPAPLPVGLTGTVQEAHPEVNQIWVDWDEHEGRKSNLILLYEDPFEVVP